MNAQKEYEEWILKNIKDEHKAESLYQLLAKQRGPPVAEKTTTSGRSVKKQPGVGDVAKEYDLTLIPEEMKETKTQPVAKKLPAELAENDLSEMFEEHANDEKGHREILTKLYGKPLPKIENKIVVYDTIGEILLDIMYDEAQAIVDYVAGLDKFWDLIAKVPSAKQQILGIVVDELHHFADTLDELDKKRIDISGISFVPKTLAPKRNKWNNENHFTKVQAVMMALHMVNGSTTPLAKEKSEIVAKLEKRGMFDPENCFRALTRLDSDAPLGIYVGDTASSITKVESLEALVRDCAPMLEKKMKVRVAFILGSKAVHSKVRDARDEILTSLSYERVDPDKERQLIFSTALEPMSLVDPDLYISSRKAVLGTALHLISDQKREVSIFDPTKVFVVAI